MTAPIAFSPSVEKPEDDEAETFADLRATLLGISEKTFVDEKEALRAVHAKAHAILKTRLTVPGGLPSHLAQGLFAKPASYDAYIRISAAPGDLLPDSVSTHRGLAIKIKDVPGERLSNGYNDGAQDFLMANGKAFNTPTAKKFLANLKMLAKTTDKAEGLKVALSATLRAVEGTLEAVGLQSATLTSLGGHPPYHPLGEEFFSQVPIRFGNYIAKLGLYPASENLKALAKTKIDVSEGYDPIRQAVRATMERESAVWELRAQLNCNLEKMPIEKPNEEWPEDLSEYQTIATLEAAPQDIGEDAAALDLDKCLAFNPWNGLAAHQPLGAINRARRVVYPASAEFRLTRNGCPFAGSA